MKVLIGGGSGLVGTALMKELQHQHIPFSYLSTSREKLGERFGGKGYYWKPDTGEIDMNSLEGVTHIVNLAGASVAKRWTPSYRAEIVNSRVQSTLTLKKAIEEAGKENIEKMVSASAVGIYPSSRSRLYTESESTPGGGFLSEVVRTWEDTVSQIDQMGVPTVMLRIGLVLAREGGALPKLLGPVKWGIGAAFGSGEQWQSWIHIKDLASMFRFVLEEEVQGVFNAVAPNPVSQEKLVNAMAEVTGRPVFLPPIPGFALKLVLGDMSSVLLDSQRVSSRRIQEAGFAFEFTNIRTALEDLLK